MAGSSLNKVMLVGNLGRDPEIRTTSDGRELASFSFATGESWKDKATGERKEKTEWHRIVVFNEGLVKIVKDYVKKGSKLYLEGQLQTRKWVDSTGQEKYTTEVILQGFGSTLILLDNKASGPGSSSVDSSFSDKSNNFDNSDLDDEIPF